MTMRLVGHLRRRLTDRKVGLPAAVLLVTILVIVLPAFVFAPVAPAWLPDPVRLWSFDMRLLIGRPLLNLTSLKHAVTGQPQIMRGEGGVTVVIERDGFDLVGSLHGIEAGSSDPAILLLHGSTPAGRRLALYRVLASKLTDLGYVVLTIDQRGYGASDDPDSLRDPSCFDFVGDAAHALEYLSALPGVDSSRVYLVGHSFGADVAATTAAAGHPIARLVLIGPARNFLARGGSPQSREFQYFVRREQKYMKLADAIIEEVFLDYRAVLSIENHRGYFSRPGHPPILLIDGELEAESDRLFLSEFHEAMAGPKAYVTIAGADHYANVAGVGPLIVYDGAAISQLVAEIDQFLRAGG